MKDLQRRFANLSPEQRERVLAQLRTDSARAGNRPALSLEPVSRDSSLALSFAQQRLWFLDQLEPGNPAYNMPPIVLHLTGFLNLAALKQSLDEIVRRHEILRTTFVMDREQPIQIVAPTLLLPLPVVDLQGLPESERESQARQLAERETRRSFDLAQGPMVRVILLHLNVQEHVLCLNMHHIVSDDWSIGVFIHEVVTLYQAYSHGQPSPLPELPIQYADYAFWQRQGLRAEGVLATQLSYWKQQLEGRLPALELPLDRPRPRVQTFHGTTLVFALPRTLPPALKALSQRTNVTLFMTLLTTFKILMHRYTGQTDLIVGTSVANRNHRKLEGMIGLFINTLALRSNLTGNPRFLDLLNQVREITLGAYAHQELPFEELVKELRPERDLSRTPVFQGMFVLRNVLKPPLILPGLTLDFWRTDSGVAQFDLMLTLIETEAGLTGELEYNTDLFNPATMARMVKHFQTLLESIVANPGQRILDVPLLSDDEQHQLVVEWNDTGTEYPQECCVHEWFGRRVEQTPDAVAVVFDNQRLTYQELNRRANQLAHYLRGLGVGRETLVGLYLERSLEMLVGLLGTLKAGGSYVPLDPSCPPERLAFMLEDTQLPVLLTQSRLGNGLERRARLICLDIEGGAISRAPYTAPPSGATAADLAYTIYTSGSTGKPKGVQVSHRAVVNFLNSMRQQLGLGKQDILLSVTTLSFDIAALELLLPLWVGGCVDLASRAVSTDGLELIARLAASQATIMQGTPATWQLLLMAGWPGNSKLKALCGGEALSPELAGQISGKVASLWNMYGPTETTIWSAMYKVEQVRTEWNSAPIGRPIANTRIYLMDSCSQLVPVGVMGELCIGGAGLARGYLHRPELTAEKFIPDPFSGRLGARLYKTGDWARNLPDGNIQFLGRTDHQVKVRGFRIELGEVEAALKQHEAVHEVVVIARDAERKLDEKRLVGYLVMKDEQKVTVGDVRRFLQAKLPDYMIPSAFMILKALPRTPTGKIDRRALPAPEGIRPELEQVFVAPQTEIEQLLATTWQEVLGVERVGIHDNFFDLGGHSLLLVQVHVKLRQALKNDLLMVDLFRHPTINALAKHLCQRDDLLSLQQTKVRFEKLAEGKDRLKQLLEKRQAGLG